MTQERDWRVVAEEASKEKDHKRLSELVEELTRLLDERKKPPQKTAAA